MKFVTYLRCLIEEYSLLIKSLMPYDKLYTFTMIRINRKQIKVSQLSSNHTPFTLAQFPSPTHNPPPLSDRVTVHRCFKFLFLYQGNRLAFYLGVELSF